MSTSSRKLVDVNRSLGNMGISQMQDTTRVIYDTVTDGVGIASFFEIFTGKSIFDTNLSKNILDTEESLVINEILLQSFKSTDQEGAFDILNTPALLNVTIGNQKVIKDFGTQFDGAPGFQHYPVNQSNGSGARNTVSIPLLTAIVIPPQVAFSATMRFANTTSFRDVKLRLGFKGFAKIFNPGMSL